jgi:predicted outer membrane lipoprotein
MIDWNLIGVIFAWVAGVFGVLACVAGIALSLMFGWLEKLDARERNEDDAWWDESIG